MRTHKHCFRADWQEKSDAKCVQMSLNDEIVDVRVLANIGTTDSSWLCATGNMDVVMLPQMPLQITDKNFLQRCASTMMLWPGRWCMELT